MTCHLFGTLLLAAATLAAFGGSLIHAVDLMYDILGVESPRVCRIICNFNNGSPE